jgi:hypothetical protein
MAKLYGVLPSDVRSRATTYDLLVTDALWSWEHEQYEKSQGKVVAPKLTQEQMQAMVNNVKQNKSIKE